MADLTAEDLATMIRDGGSENRSLEFKGCLPGQSSDDKLEFLKDVAAMANAGGGRLLYGVVDKRDENGRATGIAAAAPGAKESNLGEAILRLEQILRGGGIAPRIPGLRFYQVPGNGPDPVLVLEVPRSWLAPHMVCLDNKQLFYSRHGNGNFRLDVTQIRDAFLRSAGVETRLRRFFEERLSRILAEETPVSLVPGARIVLHLLPLAAFDGSNSLEVVEIRKKRDLFAPNLSEYRYNIDGTVLHAYREREGHRAYVQVFRSGAIESVLTDEGYEAFGSRRIRIGTAEQDLQTFLVGQLRGLAMLEVGPPFVLTGALLKAKGISIGGLQDGFPGDPKLVVDRDVVILPDVAIEVPDMDPKDALRPILEAMFNASGYLRPKDLGE
jgi:Schlafen, AlbA_2